MKRILVLLIYYLGYDLCLFLSLKINKCNNVFDIIIIKLIMKWILINDWINLI